MILRNSRYTELADKIKGNNSKVVIYGAGMIGQIVVPYFIQTYQLQDYVVCYVDMDRRKNGKKVNVGEYEYEICHPDLLKEGINNLIILITNSKFYSVIDYLDGIDALKLAEGYIVPLMQINELSYAEPLSIKRLSDNRQIPSKIHYCWFGKKDMPCFLKSCIDTWKEKCPEYDIIGWNENNYDITKLTYMREAYEKKKYGFVTDVARLDILYEQGGIYIDTDVSLFKNIDDLLYQPGFIGVEKWGNINSGGMVGAVPNHPMIKQMLDYREKIHFIEKDGSLNLETNGIYETMPFILFGMKIDNSLQYINGMTVYPSSVFHPYDYMSCEDDVKEWTISKHHFYGGWMDANDQSNRKRTQEKYKQILDRIQSSGG